MDNRWRIRYHVRIVKTLLGTQGDSTSGRLEESAQAVGAGMGSEISSEVCDSELPRKAK